MKCPKCGSRAIPTNLGRRLTADALALGGAALGKVFGVPPQATMRKIRREVCPEHKYVCSECGHIFYERV